MKILLLGANGYLGARLFFDLRSKFEVIGTYNNHQLFSEFTHLDITNKIEVERVFLEQKPDIIIHTSNHASSRLAEKDRPGFIKLNLVASQIIRDAANLIGARVIFISSFASLAPNDIYGELKLQSEKLAETVQAGYLILRPSLILGLSPNTQNDRPFNRVLKYVGTNTVAEFDTSWRFQPTYIGHISEVIIAAIKNEVWNTTVHVFCPSIQTQFSTARDILKPFNIEVKSIDKKMTMELQERDERELLDLGLPTCSYDNMIQKIHEEIKNRNKLHLEKTAPNFL